MYGCVYFPADNTLSVVKESQKNVKCDDFVRGAKCEVKWPKADVYEGTIVAIGGKSSW